MKCQRATRVIKSAINGCTKLHGNLSKSCQDVSQYEIWKCQSWENLHKKSGYTHWEPQNTCNTKPLHHWTSVFSFFVLFSLSTCQKKKCCTNQFTKNVERLYVMSIKIKHSDLKSHLNKGLAVNLNHEAIWETGTVAEGCTNKLRRRYKQQWAESTLAHCSFLQTPWKEPKLWRKSP